MNIYIKNERFSILYSEHTYLILTVVHVMCLCFGTVCPGPGLVALGSGRQHFLVWILSFWLGVWFHSLFESAIKPPPVTKSSLVVSNCDTDKLLGDYLKVGLPASEPIAGLMPDLEAVVCVNSAMGGTSSLTRSKNI